MIEVDLGHRYRDGFGLEIAFQADVRCLALFGDSGAGKTSVLAAIAGLLRPRRGRIVLDGRVLLDSAAGICLPAAERGIGYVFQDGRLFPHLDVRGNLLYGARARRRQPDDFDAIVELLALAPLLSRRPDGLSGGERQRVAIGRALLSGPGILLLDEPMTGLHRDAADQLRQYLVQLKQALAVAMVLVSHHAGEVAMLADQVVLIADGRMTGQLEPDTFRFRHGLTASIA
ncbi:MAG: ATP-binding cassette domain-containing protein [Xanthomonadales bacterium]|nr:ATP-binding cassette domain-containing protein [Xanthomonadales bacterium]